ncbi:MAG: peptidylprolyl isomerase [Alphaproteobacteria bacterium]|nr:peptidylprolyl isomerase [Alphaproteobacteria bacterium]
MKRKVSIYATVFGLIFSCFSGQAHEKTYDGIVAKVNDQIITAQDLKKRIDIFLFSTGGNLSNATMPKEVLSEYITDLIKWSTVQKYAQFAPKGGWVSKETIEATFSDIAVRNNMSKQSFVALLKSKGIDPEILKEQIKINLSWREYIQARYMRAINISEAEVRALVKDMKEKRNSEAYYVSRIFFPVANQSEERTVATKAANVIQLLKNGANFANVSRQFSSGGDTIKGGDIGWIFEGQLSQEESHALKSMKVGEYRLVKTNRGYSVLLLKDKRYGGQNSYTELRFVQVVIPFNEQPDKETVAKLTDYAKEIKALSRNAPEFIQKTKDSGLCMVSDPMTVVLEGIQTDMRKLIENIPAGGIGNPIVTPQGVIVICMLDKKTKMIKEPTADELKNQKMGEKLSILAAKELLDAKSRSEVKYFGQFSDMQTR